MGLVVPKFDYNKSYETASRLIEKFGGVGAVIKTDFTVADPLKPWDRTGAETPVSVKAVVVPLKKTQDQTHLGNSLVSKATHKGIILWDDVVDLKINDILDYQGKRWEITDATPIKPYDTGIIWTCELAGAA
jgi:hypothetical protein